MRIDRVLVVVLLLVFVGLIGGVVVAQSQEEIDLEKGLVAYWSFDEGEGDIAFDETENNNDGTLMCSGEECSPPKWVEGKIGTALEFDGVDDYVEVADSESLDITDEITIAAWIYLKSTGGAHLNTVVEKIISERGYILRTGNAKVNFVAGKDPGYLIHNGNTQFSLNSWHHIAVVVESDEYIKSYLDGGFDKATPEGDMVISSTQTLWIGSHHTLPERAFNGLIDEVRIYNRALTEEEIKELYQQEG